MHRSMGKRNTSPSPLSHGSLVWVTQNNLDSWRALYFSTLPILWIVSFQQEYHSIWPFQLLHPWISWTGVFYHCWFRWYFFIMVLTWSTSVNLGECNGHMMIGLTYFSMGEFSSPWPLYSKDWKKKTSITIFLLCLFQNLCTCSIHSSFV